MNTVPSGSMPASAKLFNILVVEDNTDFRELLCEMLVMLGHSVISKASGEDALKADGLSQIDVLISDVSLPGISGIELAKKIRAAQPEVKIILSSGYGTSIASMLNFKVTVLSKPYSLNQLSQSLVDSEP